MGEQFWNGSKVAIWPKRRDLRDGQERTDRFRGAPESAPVANFDADIAGHRSGRAVSSTADQPMPR